MSNAKTRRGEPAIYLREVVLQHQSDECLIWPYADNGNGYGKLFDGTGNRRNYVHRLVCEAVHGPAPSPAHQAAHTCGRGSEGCCNPHHIVWKTRRENEADKLVHGTHNRGDRHPNAKLSEDDVRKIHSLKGALLTREIADLFGVCPTLISMIHTGRRWGWIQPIEPAQPSLALGAA